MSGLQELSQTFALLNGKDVLGGGRGVILVRRSCPQNTMHVEMHQMIIPLAMPHGSNLQMFPQRCICTRANYFQRQARLDLNSFSEFILQCDEWLKTDSWVNFGFVRVEVACYDR